jgi:TolA-binding protein
MGKRVLLGEDDANFGVRVLLGLLAVLLLAGFAAGCGPVSDQPKQEAKKKVEAKGKQAWQEVKEKVESPQGDLEKKVDDLDEKVEAGQEDVEKKVDHVQKDVNDLQKKVNELLKMAHALERQRQKE